MLPKRKSLIRVKRRVTYTDGDSAKIVIPASQPRSAPSKSSQSSQKSTEEQSRMLRKHRPGDEMWKDVPLAIRFARSRTVEGRGAQDEKVDEKLRDMCEKAFVTGELECRAYTLEEIGSYVGISRERVRQIQEEALTNMRSIMHQRFGWEMSFRDLLDKGDSVFEFSSPST